MSVIKQEVQLSPGKFFIRQDLMTKYCFTLSSSHCLYYDNCRTLMIKKYHLHTNYNNTTYVIIAPPSVSIFNLKTMIST